MKNPVLNIVRSKQIAAQDTPMKKCLSVQILKTAWFWREKLIRGPEKIGIEQNDLSCRKRAGLRIRML